MEEHRGSWSGLGKIYRVGVFQSKMTLENENIAVGEKDLLGFIWLLCWKMLHPPLKG